MPHSPKHFHPPKTYKKFRPPEQKKKYDSFQWAICEGNLKEVKECLNKFSPISEEDVLLAVHQKKRTNKSHRERKHAAFLKHRRAYKCYAIKLAYAHQHAEVVTCLFNEWKQEKEISLSLLHIAIENCDMHHIKEVIKQHPDTVSCEYEGHTPLTIALTRDTPDNNALIINYLLEKLHGRAVPASTNDMPSVGELFLQMRQAYKIVNAGKTDTVYDFEHRRYHLKGGPLAARLWMYARDLIPQLTSTDTYHTAHTRIYAAWQRFNALSALNMKILSTQSTYDNIFSCDNAQRIVTLANTLHNHAIHYITSTSSNAQFIADCRHSLRVARASLAWRQIWTRITYGLSYMIATLFPCFIITCMTHYFFRMDIALLAAVAIPIWLTVCLVTCYFHDYLDEYVLFMCNTDISPDSINSLSTDITNLALPPDTMLTASQPTTSVPNDSHPVGMEMA